MAMQMEGAKVLNNGRKVVLDMKRKRAVYSMADFTGAACKDAQHSVQDAPPGMFYKQIISQMNSNGCRNSFEPEFNKSLLRNYSNFLKSGLPERVLLYENGAWTDFPASFTGLLKEDFRMKTVAVQVEFRGIPSLLDFLRMILVDLKEGLQQPIAWIDEFGTCFFPDPYSTSDYLQRCIQYGGRENHSLLYPETNTHEIKMHLEIEVTTEGKLNIGECNEGSSTCVKRLKTKGKPKSVNIDILDQEGSTNEKPHDEIKEVISETRPLGAMPPSNRKLGSWNGEVFLNVVKDMFIKGMGPSISAVKIHGIQHNQVSRLRTQLELFKKQVAITGKYRGNANIKYAWLGSSKEAVSRILIHGLGFNELPKTKHTYGVGVQLSSLSCSHISASHCDVDENGIQYMVLCRVILGNVELVQAGSEQSSPSCENFDSGVDDLINPEQYIVWNMNMVTHIYPEYVVCFKRSASAKGHSSESGFKDMEFDVKTSTACQDKLQPSSYPVDSTGDCNQTPNTLKMSQGKYPTIKFAGRPPKSLWMPLPELFAALEDKVPYSRMKLAYQFYDQFLNNKVSREELVQRVRYAVGDTLLKSTIISLNSKNGFRAKGAKRTCY